MSEINNNQSSISGEALKKIRTNLHLTQAELGKIVGKEDRTIGSYECGRNHIPDSVKEKLYSNFSINPTFLKTGTGEMFLQTFDPLQTLQLLSCQYSLTNLEQNILHSYLQLERKERKIIMNYIQNIINNHNKDQE